MLGLSQDNFHFFILLCILCLFYIPLDNYLRFRGEVLGNKKEILLNFIRLVNILYLPVHSLVFYMLTFGDFSIFSVWSFLEERDANEGSSSAFARAALYILGGSIFFFLASIVGGIGSYLRIRKPEIVFEKKKNS